MRAAFEPWVAVLAAAPLVLAYPLFLVLFGRSPLTIVVIGFASALAPVILKTVEGFAAVRRVLLDVGRSLRPEPGAGVPRHPAAGRTCRTSSPGCGWRWSSR